MIYLSKIKNQATILRETLSKDFKFPIKHSNALNIIAKLNGHKDWNVFSSILTSQAISNSSDEKPNKTKNQADSSMLYDKHCERQTDEKNNDVAKTIRMLIHKPLQNRPENLTKLNMVLDLADLPFVSIEKTYQFIYAMLDHTYTIIPEPEYDAILIFLQDEQLATVCGES